MTDQNDIKALNEIIEYFYGKLNNLMGTAVGEKYYSWIQSLRKAQNALIANQSLNEMMEDWVADCHKLLENVAILLKKGEKD